MSKTFGQEIKERLQTLNMRPSELARRANTSRQNIGRLMNGVVHPISGAYPTAELDTVEKIAAALNWDIDDARMKAGHAPRSQTLRKPTTIPELVEALEALGIEMPQLSGGFPPDADGEGFREIVERIWLDIGMVVTRLQKGRGPRIAQPLQLNEKETTLETEPKPLSKIVRFQRQNEWGSTPLVD